MTKYPLIILLLISVYCKAQIHIDSTVVNQYNKVMEQLKPEFNTKERSADRNAMEKEGKMGFTFFTFYKIDTLNKSESLNGNPFTYLDKNLNAMSKDLTYMDFVCMGYNDHDTLKSNLPFLGPIMISPIIYQRIVGAKTFATFEYLGQDSIFRINSAKVKSNKFIIPVTVLECSLNTSDFSVGNVIYGKAEILSDPYYIDNAGFKNGYIYQRVHCKYVFKFKIIKNPFMK